MVQAIATKFGKAIHNAPPKGEPHWQNVYFCESVLAWSNSGTLRWLNKITKAKYSRMLCRP